MQEEYEAIYPWQLQRPVRLIFTITKGARDALLVLLDYANTRTFECFPGIDTIATEARIARRHVPRYLSELKTAELVEIVKKHHGGESGSKDVYRIKPEKILALTSMDLTKIKRKEKNSQREPARVNKTKEDFHNHPMLKRGRARAARS